MFGYEEVSPAYDGMHDMHDDDDDDVARLRGQGHAKEGGEGGRAGSDAAAG